MPFSDGSPCDYFMMFCISIKIAVGDLVQYSLMISMFQFSVMELKYLQYQHFHFSFSSKPKTGTGTINFGFLKTETRIGTIKKFYQIATGTS